MRPATRTGLLLAFTILLAWLFSLAGLVVVDLSRLSWQLVLLAVFGRTFLQTGLFIVGHDAMHGTLWPERKRWNHRIGALALQLYAALPYRACCRNHHHHHLAPGSVLDPDGPPHPNSGVVSWYIRFMAGYLSWPQMTRLLGGWTLLALVAQVMSVAAISTGIASSVSAANGMSAANDMSPASSVISAISKVLLFYSLPLLLSSLQMFAFGTYFPHRKHRHTQGLAAIESLNLSAPLSLLACYHFGYHREHHQWPDLAWFELPERRSSALATANPLRSSSRWAKQI
ncbi:fatty acid desaturase [Synechococcus sp. CS-1328]|uniref:fatty acid desaturase n=1 Tax=Synechococcus sp. CS-1328 TaxID=2847976 RepID=UPI00223B5A94|nr:fatty acid desaturase [Synechococcus sp. CS-1328]MCT0224057.1 fatty acid desaturase [Synechococcus sp. CS-1328]